ncbi:hypothetical protein ABPG75_011915 [Micractinium tetrahymenae]
MLVASEHASAAHGGANAGVAYFQNCRPSGPCAWALVELADRTLRQREGLAHMRSVYRDFDAGTSAWEQRVLDDVISSVAAGQPVILAPDLHAMQPRWFDENRRHYMAGLRAVQARWPDAWHARAAGRGGPILEIAGLQLPSTVGKASWRRHARMFYPPHRGASSSAFMQLAREASPLPLLELGERWEPPSPPPPPEHFAFLPWWLAGGFRNRGVRGYWGLQPPAQVVAHAAYAPGPGGSSLWKTYLIKAYGWWHWEIDEALLTGGNAVGALEPKLLTLAPGLQLLTETEEEFRDRVVQLARLAAVAGRRFVVPHPPCNSSWVRPLEQPVAVPPEEDGGDVVEGTMRLAEVVHDPIQVLDVPLPAYLLPEQQQQQQQQQRGQPRPAACLWMRRLLAECLACLVAEPDAAAFVQRKLNADAALPGPHNTLWYHGGGGAAVAEHELPNRAAWLAAVAAFPPDTVPVLFLGALPRLTDGKASLSPLGEECSLCYLVQEAGMQHMLAAAGPG